MTFISNEGQGRFIPPSRNKYQTTNAETGAALARLSIAGSLPTFETGDDQPEVVIVAESTVRKALGRWATSSGIPMGMIKENTFRGAIADRIEATALREEVHEGIQLSDAPPRREIFTPVDSSSLPAPKGMYEQ